MRLLPTIDGTKPNVQNHYLLEELKFFDEETSWQLRLQHFYRLLLVPHNTVFVPLMKDQKFVVQRVLLFVWRCAIILSFCCYFLDNLLRFRRSLLVKYAASNYAKHWLFVRITRRCSRWFQLLRFFSYFLPLWWKITFSWARCDQTSTFIRLWCSFKGRAG